MNIGYALNRGINFGTTVGALVAIAGLFMAAAPLTAAGGAGLGIAPAVFGSWLGGLNAFLGPLAEIMFAGLAGAAVGGTLFTATHVITHAIPGLPKLLGDTTPDRRHAPVVRRGRAQAPAIQQELVDEFDDRNVGFRRQIEEERQRDEVERQMDMSR